MGSAAASLVPLWLPVNIKVVIKKYVIVESGITASFELNLLECIHLEISLACYFLIAGSCSSFIGELCEAASYQGAVEFV